jgi:hypothetical protein
MHNSLEAMEIALRVLTAASYKRAPDPSDLAKLEEYTGPKPEGMDVDEYACRAVQEALKRRADLRAKRRADGAESAHA